MIEVVTGVIRRGDRVLLTQRTASRDFPLHWESPGGKVEPAEIPFNALLRELREEIGLYEGMRVAPAPFAQAVFAPPVVSRPCRIQYYFIDVPAHWTPVLLDVVGVGWFSIEEMRGLNLIPGNVVVLKYLEMLEAGGFPMSNTTLPEPE